MTPEGVGSAWRKEAWNAHSFSPTVRARILAKPTITAGALEPSYRSGRQLCIDQGPNCPHKDAHSRGQGMRDEQMLTPSMCVVHATEHRVNRPGLNYRVSEVAYNMDRVWPEHCAHGRKMPAPMSEDVAGFAASEDGRDVERWRVPRAQL